MFAFIIKTLECKSSFDDEACFVNCEEEGEGRRGSLTVMDGRSGVFSAVP